SSHPPPAWSPRSHFAASARWRRYSRAGRPPHPQLSVSTSSMTTKVDSSGLPRTSRRSSLTPLMRGAFSSLGTGALPGLVPSRVAWRLTMGMVFFRSVGGRSVTGTLAAVDVQDLAGYEAGLFEIDDGVSDVGHLAHVADRMQATERGVRLGGMHRRLDDAGRDRVHAHALLGVFDGERLRRRVQPALGQRGQHRRHTLDGVINEARGDLHDMAATLLLHLSDG